MLKKSLLIIALAAGIGIPLAGLLLPGAAQAADAKVGKKVGEPLAAALEAAKKGEYAQALAKLKVADAVAGKTAFEQFQINETYGFVYLKQRNYAAAAAAYERNLNSGQLPAAQVNDRVKQLAQLNFQSPRNLNKVIEYSNRWLKATGSNDPAMYAMLGQAYQLSGNDKAAIAATQSAVRNSPRPEENWLRILLQSYSALDDTKGVNATIDTLVRTYPTKDNWRLLSNTLRKQALSDDRIAINVYRLMDRVGIMDKPEMYTEAAIIGIQSGLPAESVKIMEQGLANKILTPTDARAQRILADARQKMAAQRQSLAQLTSGPDDLKSGEILLSYGQVDQAAAKARAAISKAQAEKDPAQRTARLDQAYMLLGRCELQLKQDAEARKAFSQVRGEDTAPIAKLWSIAAQ